MSFFTIQVLFLWYNVEVGLKCCVEGYGYNVL